MNTEDIPPQLGLDSVARREVSSDAITSMPGTLYRRPSSMTEGHPSDL